jgi:sugar lactone lactonase YvrE
MRLQIKHLCLVAIMLVAMPSFADSPLVQVVIGPMSPVPDAYAASDLNNPFAVEFMEDGRMLIVEYTGGRLLSWSEKTGLTSLAGGPEAAYVDGSANEARFNALHNLAIVDANTVLLSEHLNHTVRKFDFATKSVSTFAGTQAAGPSKPEVSIQATRFNQPICISLSPNKQSLLIADINNRCIRRLNFATNLVTVIAGNGQKGVPIDGSLAVESPLVDPRGAIESSSGEIFLIERGGNALRKIDAAGKITTIAGSGKSGFTDGAALQAQLNGPKHLCFGDANNIYIADDNNHAIRKYDPIATTLSTVELGEFKLNRPHGVCVQGGWLYIADSFHNRIVRVKL